MQIVLNLGKLFLTAKQLNIKTIKLWWSKEIALRVLDKEHNYRGRSKLYYLNTSGPNKATGYNTNHDTWMVKIFKDFLVFSLYTEKKGCLIDSLE